MVELKSGSKNMVKEDQQTEGNMVPIKDLGEACPPRPWDRENICDVSILTYRYNLRVDNRLVECTLRYRVERCTEGYVLSDLLHSMTLFPGEEVFLSVRSRNSITRFTENTSFSASQISRSSDRIWMETYKNLATDFSESSSDTLKTSAHSEFSQTNVGGGGGVNILGIVKIGGGASHVSGDFDASSSSEFFHELNQHLQSSFHQTNQVVRDTSSVSLTQINSHRDATVETHDELEVSTRRFKNINECHTVTHYFYQIAKRQRVKIELIERSCRAINEFASSAVSMKPIEVSIAANQQVVSNAQQAEPGIKAAVAEAQPNLAAANFAAANFATRDQLLLQNVNRVSFAAFQEAERARKAAIAKADKIMAALPEVQAFEQVSIIPTEALYVQSELGDCLLCEPYVVAKHELELERLKLENRKLRREIDLLDKAQEYRCCDDLPDNVFRNSVHPNRCYTLLAVSALRSGTTSPCQTISRF